MTERTAAVPTQADGGDETSVRTVRTVRPEIQGLRAIAVLAVVAYHLWPHHLTGGYAGVDVFFVISGFLITGHLVRELDRTGKIRLAQFWARRARELLPASLLVISASIVATLALVPQSLWQQFFREFGASAVYIINWVLASDSVDYLAATNQPSPVQHYWSLAVEEQFYLAWPLLILASVLIVRRKSQRMKRLTLQIALGVIVGASLAYSVYLTVADPSPAYFSTFVRAWEFGAGGLIAVAAPLVRHEIVRAVTSWAGVGMIVTTIVVYTPRTPFPGWHALLPVVGTALVIWSGTSPLRWAPSALMRFRPIQWLGDISYSLYLWHWPLVVFAAFVIGDLRLPQTLSIFAISIALAAVTKRFVEDPIRTSRALTSKSPALTLGLTAASAAIVIAVSASVWVGLQNTYDASVTDTQEVALAHAHCFGAAAFAPENQPCHDPALDGVLYPVPGSGQHDGVIRDGCRVNAGGRGPGKCTIVKGSKGAPRIALIGDSHAEQWAPAVAAMAKQRHWTLITYLKGGCSFSSAHRTDQSMADVESCDRWNDKIREALQHGNLDAVIVTDWANKSYEGGYDGAVTGLVDQWKAAARETDSIFVAIKDTPLLPFDPQRCLTGLGADAAKLAQDQCSAKRSVALIPDPLVDAATSTHTPLIDLTDYMCDVDRCYSTVGSVVVYRDDNHFGGTFSASLAPYFAREFDLKVGPLGP